MSDPNVVDFTPGPNDGFDTETDAASESVNSIATSVPNAYTTETDEEDVPEQVLTPWEEAQALAAAMPLANAAPPAPPAPRPKMTKPKKVVVKLTKQVVVKLTVKKAKP